jgi:phosphoenolpyruvate carboxykinase (ATP)
VVTTHAWHALFVNNMFLRPTKNELDEFVPDYLILHAPELETDPSRHAVRSKTAIAISFGDRTVLIAGTEYAGEIKKSVFTIMNGILPQHDVLPMHCSANVGSDGGVALFFGLSGTGKTTLSSDPDRPLIGDDEHAWSSTGVFNIEGGCYAKVINLSRDAEPEIWKATHKFGTVLENVVIDDRGLIDLASGLLTENTRACYSITSVAGSLASGQGGHPGHVVMLTADAFGVLPPIAMLTAEQAIYHFLSGYTARLAGTEKGLGKHPEATFSTCFGAPFLPRSPEIYGRLLEQLIHTHNANCWLFNTGWTGGPYGEGHRMSISHTRALLRGVFDGNLTGAKFEREPILGFLIPTTVDGVPAHILNARNSWANKDSYDRAAKDLAARFASNFEKFACLVSADVLAPGPRTADRMKM